MILLNIAMAVFFCLIGVAVCYIAEEQKFDECIKDWIAEVVGKPGMCVGL